MCIRYHNSGDLKAFNGNPFTTQVPFVWRAWKDKDGTEKQGWVPNTDTSISVADALKNRNFTDPGQLAGAFGNNLVFKQHETANNITNNQKSTFYTQPNENGKPQKITWKDYFSGRDSLGEDWLEMDRSRTGDKDFDASYYMKKNLEYKAIENIQSNIIPMLNTIADPYLRKEAAERSGVDDFIQRLQSRRERMLDKDTEMAKRANLIIDAYNKALYNGISTPPSGKEDLMKNVVGSEQDLQMLKSAMLNGMPPGVPRI